jgi:hypothetical protein
MKLVSSLTPCLALGLGLLVLPGCMIVVGGDGPDDAVTQHFEDVDGHGPLCAAIDVAAGIPFSSDRASTLVPIAARRDLTEHEQEFLIDVTVDTGGFGSDAVEVLIVLARNPSLTPGARTHLGRRQRDVSLFPSDRKRLAAALAETGASTDDRTGGHTDGDADAGADSAAPDA